MNKLIIFDLDGVLIDSKLVHFDALNMALAQVNKNLIITEQEQKETYEGLPTSVKLKLLTKHKGLDPIHYPAIWKNKQEFSTLLFNNIIKDNNLIQYFEKIKNNNIHIAVASNSIRSTVKLCLEKLGIDHLVEVMISNEDVNNPKPHPEIYWKAMSHFGVIAEDTVIFEDSIVGKLGARDSHATLIEIRDRQDLTMDKVDYAIDLLQNSKPSWVDPELNVLIPMAGLGSRFADAGYTFPKPLIDVNGKPMIHAVIDSLSIKAKYTYIVQKEHFIKYHLDSLLNVITPGCNIVQIDGITEGAAVTALLAKSFIDNNKPLIIANSDQIVRWNSRDFVYDCMKQNVDGGIVTFKSTHPKWSYAKVNDNGYVIEVAEKKTISELATVGIYYWKHGSDFVKYAEQMINNNVRTNNEFYICPVYNEAIQDNKKIITHNAEKMWGIGTPEDLNYFLNNRSTND